MPYPTSALNQESLQLYRTLLREREIPSKSHSFYLHWVRLYLNYCQEGGFSPHKQEAITQWMQQIAKSYSSGFLQAQAKEAVMLFLQQKQIDIEYKEHTSNPVPELKPFELTWQVSFLRIKQEIQVRHYSPQTLKHYYSWLKKFQQYHTSKQPDELDTADVKAFLTYLAVERNVSAATQNQAFNALLFFYRHVLQREFGKVQGVVRAKRRQAIPVVLSRAEIDRLLPHLKHPYDLLVKLLYGCGLRISEGLNLRVQDLNFDLGVLTIFRGKGNKHRTVPLPKSLYAELQAQLDRVHQLHQQDLARDYQGVFLRDNTADKYHSAAKDYIWQWLFPAIHLTYVPETGEYKRYHLHDTHVSRALKQARQAAGIPKRITAHTFRHSYATHLLQAHYDIQTIQQLLGHSDIRTTMIYLHTMPQENRQKIQSPLDFTST